MTDLKTKTAFQNAIKQAIILPVTLSIVIAAVFLWETQDLKHAMDWLDHADEAISRANHIQKLFIDAETGVRGFDINRDQVFLEPYNSAVKSITPEIESLKKFVFDNPSQVERLKKIDGQKNEWLAVAQKGIEEAKKGGTVSAGGLNHNGKRIMDGIRSEFDKFVGEEERLRQERSDAAEHSSRMVNLTVILLGLILALVIVFWTRRLLFNLSGQYEDALEKLHESREWFETTLSSIGDAVIVVNPQSKVDFLNPIAEQLTGWSLKEATGLPMDKVFRIVNEKTREVAFNPVGRVLAEGIIVGLANHTVLIDKNGKEYPIEDSAAPIRGDSGKVLGVVLVFRDVTERHRSTSNLEKAVKSRDEFLSIASHELKTPLTALKLQLQFSLRNLKTKDNSVPDPEKIKHIVETCYAQTLRLDSLIDGLLDVTRIQQGKLQFHFESADITEIVKRTVSQMSPQLESAKCSIEITSEGPVVANCDKFRIEQVVTNLLSNAMKYGPGAPISIVIRKVENEVELSVTDRGIGIPREKQALIFERFERAIDSTNVSGLGLGLYIVRQIVSGHDGKIEVTSEENKGATFSIKIPIQSALKDFTRTESELLKNS